MNWSKVLSIFQWNKNKEQPKEESNISNKSAQQIKTIGGIKAWMNKELPPLAWQRVNLRVIKYAISKHNLNLLKVPDETVLPEDLLQEIIKYVKELYNKEISI